MQLTKDTQLIMKYEQVLNIQDPRLLSIIASVEDNEQTAFVYRATEIGLLSLDKANTSENVDFISLAFEGLRSETADKFTKIEKHVSDTLVGVEEKIEKQIGSFKEEIEKIIGENGKIDNLFDSENGNGITAMIRKQLHQDLDINDKSSPLNKMMNSLLNGQSRVQDTISSHFATAKEVEKGTQKGFVFEQDIYTHLEKSAKNFGDNVTFVGNSKEGNRRAGDVLIEVMDDRIDDIPLICVEAKDWTKITLPILKTNVKEGVRIRQADAGIGIVKNSSALPQKCRPFMELPQNLSICSFEEEGLYLTAAYRLIRSALIQQSLLRNAKTSKEPEIDIAKIKSAKIEISSLLKDHRCMKSGLSQICDTSTRISSQLDIHAKKILDQLTLIEESLI